ncbi:MAG: glycosyltransferase family 2 protein [Kiritimatiellia bacterium]
MKISVAICTGMKRDLGLLLTRLLHTACDEILIVGTEGQSFYHGTPPQNPRIRVAFTRHDLASKRNLAIAEGRGDILAFVDDDALIANSWYDALRMAFVDTTVGVATGPSILPAEATLWERIAQLAMAATPYSHKRYTFARKGYAEWYDVIGANLAFRREALAAAGGCPAQFLAQGDDLAMAHAMVRAGWRVLYDPDMFVYHKPHPPGRQIVQIYRFGRAAKRLAATGLAHPRKDPAYYWLLPVYILFGSAYLLGMLREALLPHRNRPFVLRIKGDP